MLCWRWSADGVCLSVCLSVVRGAVCGLAYCAACHVSLSVGVGLLTVSACLSSVVQSVV